MKVIVVQNPSGFDVPIGGVFLWYGLEDELPFGYEVYSDAGGFFLLGGSSIDLTPAGALTHVHGFPNIEIKGNHNHVVSASGSGGAGGTNVSNQSNTNSATTGHTHGYFGSSTPAGGHTHTIADSEAATNLPKHKTLYYVRRVA